MKASHSYGYRAPVVTEARPDSKPSVVLAFFPSKRRDPSVIRIVLLTGDIQFGARTCHLGTGSRFKIATALLAAAGHIVSRGELFDFLWGDREDGEPLDKNLDVHLMRARRELRRRLDIDVQTVWGRGWIIDLPALPEMAIAA